MMQFERRMVEIPTKTDISIDLMRFPNNVYSTLLGKQPIKNDVKTGIILNKEEKITVQKLTQNIGIQNSITKTNEICSITINDININNNNNNNNNNNSSLSKELSLSIPNLNKNNKLTINRFHVHRKSSDNILSKKNEKSLEKSPQAKLANYEIAESPLRLQFLEPKEKISNDKADNRDLSVRAVLNEFNRKNWIHKRMFWDSNSPGRSSEETSLRSSNSGSMVSMEIKDENWNEWTKNARDCNLEQLMSLLGRDVNMLNSADPILGYTALHWAAKKGRQDLITTLIFSGAFIDPRSISGLTPLHLAVQAGHETAIKQLVLEMEADIHARDNNSRRPVDYLRPNCSSVLRQILTQGFITTQPEDKVELKNSKQELENELKKFKRRNSKKSGFFKIISKSSVSEA